MPSWKKLITSGSDAAIPSVSTAGNFTITSNKIGVGTSSPEEKLSIDNGNIQLENNKNLTWSDIGDGNNGRVRIYGSEDSDYIRMNVDNSNTKSFALTGTGVGIGNLNPTKKLTIEGDVSASGDFLGTSTSTGSFGAGYIDNKLGIGTTSPSVELEVAGAISGSVIRASGDVIAFNSSDERFKDNIKPISEPLWKLSKIGGYTFDWNDNQDVYKGHDVGVIAQEIHKVLPEVVGEKNDGYLGVKYEKIVPLLIESIKELNKKIEDIEKNCDCLNK